MRFKDGTELTYRLNRGDVRAIVEVWMSDAYKLPFEVHAPNIIDLGANIGAASVWLARHYGAKRLVAVEPVPENAALTRINVERTGIDAEVITAAVGPKDGTARFQLSEVSTLGRLGADGVEVAVTTPQSVMKRFPPGERIGIVKVDIEGAEQDLFEGDLEWLDRVDCLVAELHAGRVDYQRIIRILNGVGFTAQQISTDNLYSGPTDLTVVFHRPAEV